MSVEPFNFRKPGRLGSDLEQRLGGWLRTGCVRTPDRLAKYMPYRPELEFRGLEIVRPGEGLARLPDSSIGYRIALGTEEMLTMLVFPRQLALALVAAMLGDPGSELPGDRELTLVEESLCEYVVQNLLLPVLQETWPGMDPLKIEVRQKEPTPKWVRFFPADQNIVVCSFEVKAPFGEQTWHWLMPQKGLLEQFAQPASPAERTTDAARPRLEAVVQQVPAEIRVTLGSVELPLSYLAGLRVGDLVILNQRVSEPLTASVAGQKKFHGWPGRIGSRQAFQIESVTEC